MLLKNGQVLTHTRLAELFNVKSLKTTRFIKEKNTVVIITDFTKGDHPDKWIGDALHYTGGPVIAGSANARMADSRSNGVHMCLFQVLNPGEYTYCGTVRLAGDPYTELRSDGRLVWVFPLQTDRTVEKIRDLVFPDMKDYKDRGEQAIRHFIRRRARYVGYPVRHVEHGMGTVDAFDGSILTVTFQNNQTKHYNFNKSVRGGYLQFPD